MTTIKYMSDLHFEWWDNPVKKEFFIESLPVVGDILVVAGDLDSSASLSPTLHRLCDHFAQIPVVFVPGNHDYYGSSLGIIDAELAELQDKIENLAMLNDGFASIDGVRFFGGTLWFEFRPDNYKYKHQYNDFQYIKGFDPAVYKKHQATKDLLEKIRLWPNTVVVTHMAPLPDSIPGRYLADPINRFFMTNLSGVIYQNKPVAWIHGHTHTSFDYTKKDTRVVCNPYGYHNPPAQLATYEPNRDYDPTKTIEIPTG